MTAAVTRHLSSEKDGGPRDCVGQLMTAGLVINWCMCVHHKKHGNFSEYALNGLCILRDMIEDASLGEQSGKPLVKVRDHFQTKNANGLIRFNLPSEEEAKKGIVGTVSELFKDGVPASVPNGPRVDDTANGAPSFPGAASLPSAARRQ